MKYNFYRNESVILIWLFDEMRALDADGRAELFLKLCPHYTQRDAEQMCAFRERLQFLEDGGVVVPDPKPVLVRITLQIEIADVGNLSNEETVRIVERAVLDQLEEVCDGVKGRLPFAVRYTFDEAANSLVAYDITSAEVEEI